MADKKSLEAALERERSVLEQRVRSQLETMASAQRQAFAAVSPTGPSEGATAAASAEIEAMRKQLVVIQESFATVEQSRAVERLPCFVGLFFFVCWIAPICWKSVLMFWVVHICWIVTTFSSSFVGLLIRAPIAVRTELAMTQEDLQRTRSDLLLLRQSIAREADHLTLLAHGGVRPSSAVSSRAPSTQPASLSRSTSRDALAAASSSGGAGAPLSGLLSVGSSSSSGSSVPSVVLVDDAAPRGTAPRSRSISLPEETARATLDGQVPSAASASATIQGQGTTTGAGAVHHQQQGRSVAPPQSPGTADRPGSPTRRRSFNIKVETPADRAAAAAAAAAAATAAAAQPARQS